MMKLSKVEQLEELNLEKEIKEIVTNYINILEDNYESDKIYYDNFIDMMANVIDNNKNIKQLIYKEN